MPDLRPSGVLLCSRWYLDRRPARRLLSLEAECGLLGAVLAWLNFRWLRRGLDALVAASAAQAGAEKPRVPLGLYFAAVFRYGLIALIVYVIFKLLQVPLASMVVGMCALAAAAIAASVYELFTSER
jgi:hypothetical protein